MPTIVGLAGSLRKGSFNDALLRAAIERAPSGTTVEHATIRGIPLYDGDVEEASGIPQIVQDLKDRIAKADGLLLVTPEYNHSIPGVFKNAIDWLSRPGSDIARVFGGRPVALMGATPGGAGTIMAQAAWLPIFRTLGTKPWFGSRLIVSGAAKVVDSNGKLIDEKISKQVQDFMAGFVSFIDSGRRVRGLYTPPSPPH